MRAPRGLGSRLRGAARPSLGLALTVAGAALALVVVFASHERRSQAGHQVRVCRSVVSRSTVQRQASASETVVKRKPITATRTVTARQRVPGGSASVSVTASATSRRILVTRALVRAGATGSATASARASACAFNRDRGEASYRANLEAKHRGTDRADRLAAPKAVRDARRRAAARARARAADGAQARLDRAVVQEQAKLDAAALSDARMRARSAARDRAAAVTSP